MEPTGGGKYAMIVYKNDISVEDYNVLRASALPLVFISYGLIHFELYTEATP
jgi:hypothetical protein